MCAPSVCVKYTGMMFPILAMALHAFICLPIVNVAAQVVAQVPLPMEPFRKRTDLAKILNNLKMEKGVEVGVKKGEFALHNLKHWPLNKEYWLVDLWKHQENYEDNSNRRDKDHQKNYRVAMKSLSKYQKQLQVCRNYSTICATLMPDEYFDFVYIDARHDRKGSQDDLVAYWPKVKQGGRTTVYNTQYISNSYDDKAFCIAYMLLWHGMLD